MKKIKFCATFFLSLCCLMGAAACGNKNKVSPQSLPGQERTVTDNMTDIHSEEEQGCPDSECPHGKCPHQECPDGKCPHGECPDGECPHDKCPDGKCPDGKCPHGKCPHSECPGGKCPDGKYPHRECPKTGNNQDTHVQKSGSNHKSIPEDVKPTPDLPLNGNKFPDEYVLPIPRPKPILVPRREF